MSASGMIAFQALNLSTNFDFDNYYPESYYAEICEGLHELIKQKSLDIFNKENNKIVFDTLNPLFPKNEGKPNPVGLVLVAVQEQVKAGDATWNYWHGDSFLEPMKDFIDESLDFGKDALINPLWDTLKKPLIIAGVGIGLKILIPFLFFKGLKNR